MKSTALQNFFQVEREHCNQMVASVRHQSRSLDTEEFTWFISACLDPFMADFDSKGNQESFPVALAGFKHGLELASLNWLKSEQKREILLQLWTGFYPKIIGIVQREPALTFKQTANLLSHLYGLNPGHPEKWLEIMSRVTNLLDNHPQLSQTGLVGAWMSGLAHYRDSAMKQLAMLPEALAKGLLGLPVDRDFQVFLDELRRNRWLTAQSPADAKPASIHRIETRVGACALLGGDFPVPPEVVGGDGQFFVRSGELVWQMHVDAFGSSLIPCDPEGLKHHEIATERADKSLLQSLLADISDISSSVHLADTLALTSRETFAVIVLSVAVVQSGGAA